MTALSNDIQAYLDAAAQQRGVAHLLEKIKRTSIRSEGVKINLEIIETDFDAPTVVFIPGTTVYALCYVELLSQLAESGYNVIGFDPRGHGLSEGERGDYTLDNLIKDTQAVITYAIENYNSDVSLLGTRQGGIVALYVCAADDRPRSIICHNLADFSDPATKHGLKLFSGYRKIFRPFWMGASKLFPNMKVNIRRNFKTGNEDWNDIGGTMQALENDPLIVKKISAKTLGSFLNSKPARLISEIETPVFVLQAEKENIFPLDYIEHIYQKLQCKKKLAVIKGVTHTMMFENAKELIPVIANWLSEIHSKGPKPSAA